MRFRIVLFAAAGGHRLARGLWCRRVIQFLFPISHFLDQLLLDAANGFRR
jgi:hypothetical protein